MSFAGVSVISDGKLLSSTPAFDTDTASGYHLLVVEGYSRTKDTPNAVSINSRPFTVGGHNWRIGYYPNGDLRDCADFISLDISLDDDDVTKEVKALYSFSFVDQVEKQGPAYIREAERGCFSNDVYCWASSRFIRRDALEQSKHLTNDGFTIRCDIMVTEAEKLNANDDTAVAKVPLPDIRQHFSHLLQTKVGADVTFEVGGEVFAAHRCVLAARSAVFTAALFGPMKEATAAGVVQVKDMEANVFRGLLDFIYTDSLLPEMGRIPTTEDVTMEDDAQYMERIIKEEEQELLWLQKLFVAADRYDLQRLKLICEEHLAGHIGVSSVTNTLALAEQHHCQGLKEACLQFLKALSPESLQQVMATDGWEHITSTYPSVLNELIAKLASKV